MRRVASCSKGSENATFDRYSTGSGRTRSRSGGRRRREGCPLFRDALFRAPFREPVRGRVSLTLELFAHRAAIGAALERGDAGEAARRARKSLELVSGVEPGARRDFSQRDFFIEKLARALRSAPFATGPGALARPESAREEKTLAAMAGENGEWWCDLSDRFEQLLFRVSRHEPRESPLLLAANAGCVATPTLSKLADVLAKTPKTPNGKTRLADFRETHEDDDLCSGEDNVASLPVEIPLPPSSPFGSTFACPVRRDAVFDPAEPIMMLPCGVLISEGRDRRADAAHTVVGVGGHHVQVYQLLEETKPNECKRSVLLKKIFPKKRVSKSPSRRPTKKKKRDSRPLHRARRDALASSPNSLVTYFATRATLYASPSSRLSATCVLGAPFAGSGRIP